MKARKYYQVADSSWGKTPQVNTNRYDCDTFFYTEDGKLAGGFVYCRLGYHPIPKDEAADKFVAEYATDEYETTESNYIDAREWFYNN